MRNICVSINDEKGKPNRFFLYLEQREKQVDLAEIEF